jgi:hypothetical protein
MKQLAIPPSATPPSATPPSATKVSPDSAKDVARCSKTPKHSACVQETSSSSSDTSSDSSGTESASPSKRAKIDVMNDLD